jgi:hypothetical protein
VVGADTDDVVCGTEEVVVELVVVELVVVVDVVEELVEVTGKTVVLVVLVVVVLVVDEVVLVVLVVVVGIVVVVVVVELEVEVSGTVVVVGTVAGTVVDGTVVVLVVVDVVDVVIDSHRDRLLIERIPGEQQVSIEYCRNENKSPSSTGTDSEPVALFCCVSKVYVPLTPYCGGSYTQPSLV